MAHDVTELRRLDEMKVQLAHHVNHELRNPTAAVMLGLQMLMDGPLDDLQRRSLQTALHSAEHLKRMTDDLLDVTRLQTGKLRVDLETVALSAPLRECADGARPDARSRGVSLETRIEEGLSARADPLRVRQVACNLLDNALKFTPKGGRVTLSAVREGSEVLVAVEDTGPGVPAADLKKIFDRLYQSERTLKQQSRGLGLGLSICRELVERMAGRIWAESEPGRGARFSFTLPAA